MSIRARTVSADEAPGAARTRRSVRRGRWFSGWLRTSRTVCSGASALAGLLDAAFHLQDGAEHPEMAVMRRLGSACGLWSFPLLRTGWSRSWRLLRVGRRADVWSAPAKGQSAVCIDPPAQCCDQRERRWRPGLRTYLAHDEAAIGGFLDTSRSTPTSGLYSGTFALRGASPRGRERVH